MAPVSSTFAVLLVLLPLATGLCHRSADCADSLACTVDYCEPTKNTCYHFPRGELACGPSPPSAVGTAYTFAAFREEVNSDALSPRQRLVIVEAAIKTLRDVHPHRDLHLTLLGVDPVGPLSRLARRTRADIAANATATTSMQTTLAFHQSMIKIFNSLQDLHTTYRAPGILATSVAALPFVVRHYYTPSRKRGYVISDIAHGAVLPPSFRKGTRLVSFNGVPIDAAVRSAGAQGIGANPAAQIARGCRRLTRRFLFRQMLPYRRRARVGYLSGDGGQRFIEVEWMLADFAASQEGATDAAAATASSGVHADAFAKATQRILPKLAQMSWKMSGKSSKLPKAARIAVDGSSLVLSSDPPAPNVARPSNHTNTSPNVTALPVDPLVADHIRGFIVPTPSGPLGVIKIYDYRTFFFPQFLLTFLRLVMSLQDQPAVIDIRGNNGGIAYLAQTSIQFFTSRRVEPVLFSTRITRTTARLENALPAEDGKRGEETSFTASVWHGLRAGDQFSGAFSLITALLFSEYIGERFRGEMLVLTDGETYSSGDVFAASCQDNAAGVIVGEDATTGAGGSSSALYSLWLHKRLPKLFPRLPGGVDFALSYRRMNRVGKYAGIAVESFGVTPDVRYYPTYRDRVEGDVDLYGFLARLIKRRKKEKAGSKPTPRPVPLFNLTLDPEDQRNPLPGQDAPLRV